mgnify:CR=1 FL=1
MEFDDFERAVDYVGEEHAEATGREFEASVREALSSMGFDTLFTADVELDGEVVTSYEVDTNERTYGLSINRDAGELDVYARDS